MKKKIALLLAGMLCLSILTIGGVTTPFAADVQLNYANFPPAPTFPCVQMERWKKEVEKRTKGKVAIQTFPGGTLLGAKEMFDGVVSGVADIGCVCMPYQPGRFVITNAIGLPLQIPSAKVGSAALWDLVEKYKPKAFSTVKILSVFTTTPSSLMSKKPVRSLEDLKGLSVRGSGAMGAAILTAWGASGVGMPMPEVPEALQKGVVSAVFTSLEVMKDMKFAETCRYATVTNTNIYPFAVIMNMDKWNALPKDVQKVMNDLSRDQALWTGEYADKHAQEAIAWSKKTYNAEFIELTDAQKAKWNEPLQPIINKWIKDTKAKGYPSEEIVKDLKNFTKKYE